MCFNFRKIGRRYSLNIGNVNMSYCFKGEKDKYITLGVNCFPRTKLTKFGIKAKKADGELSYPFDLCAIQLESVAQILKNDFSDYFDDLYFDCSLNIWINKKYSIKYYHDKDIDIDKFMKRYKQRIENFRVKTSLIENPVFISAVFNEKYNPELYLDIYSSLQRYSKGNIDYLIANITNEVKNNCFIADGNIYYKEILAPCSNYSDIWTDTSLDKKLDNIYNFYRQYINFVKNKC